MSCQRNKTLFGKEYILTKEDLIKTIKAANNMTAEEQRECDKKKWEWCLKRVEKHLDKFKDELPDKK